MPYSHLAGHGFQKRKHRLTTKEFIEKANKIHKNLYDYSKVEYKGSKVKVCIGDSEYEEFWQTPESHLGGQGNPNRSWQGDHTINKDHIIPISILGSRLYKEVDTVGHSISF